jgi:Zn-dependent metalloprotease
MKSGARLVGAGNSEITIYDAEEGYDRTKKLVRSEGDPLCNIEDADNAYQFSVDIRNFLREIHGRNGIDASGMRMITTVRYGKGYNNAYWDGTQMTEGKGDGIIFLTFVLLDVHGHEVEHGVTEFHANGKFVYRAQPGALNEHLSDVGGECLEMWVKKILPVDHNWVIGNGIFVPGIKGTGIRNMLHPGTGYDDPKLGKDPQPAKMSDYYKGSGDNYGVHYNSGIPNRAFALVCCELNDWIVPKKIWYATRAAVPNKPSFAQFAATSIDAAKALGFAKYESVLRNAWKDVEVTPDLKAIDKDVDAEGDDVEAFVSA